MGIATSAGIIYDFAGSYFVSEDSMAFGWPTRYLILSVDSVGKEEWDRAILEASEEYRKHEHNLCGDNCHNHVALALNSMQYNSKSNWTAFRLAVWMFFCGKYTGCCGFLKTWLPFGILCCLVIGVALAVHFTRP